MENIKKESKMEENFEKKKIESPAYKVFFITEPFPPFPRGNPSGDSDYVMAITKLFGDSGKYLTYDNNNEEYQKLCKKITFLRRLDPEAKNVVTYPKNYKGNMIEGYYYNYIKQKEEKVSELEQELLDDTVRKKVVDDFTKFILKNKQEGETAILNLQIRPPETGMMLFPEDLNKLKKQGIKVVVTCHEYKLNEGKNSLNQISLRHFYRANKVIFFNKQDEELAREEYSNRYEKNTLFPLTSPSKVAVPLTVGEPYFNEIPKPAILTNKDNLDKLLEKPPNILCFGSIRRGKGSEFACDLASKINEKKLSSKVIIAGEPTDDNVLAELIVKSCNVYSLINTFNLDVQTKDKNPYMLSSEVEKKLKEIFSDPKTHLQRVSILTTVAEWSKRDDCKHAMRLPIEFNFSIPPKDMKNIFARCKYAFCYDKIKGFANNASAMITQLAQGCILFANKGECTPEDAFDVKKEEITTPPIVQCNNYFTIPEEIFDRENNEVSNKNDKKQSKNYQTLVSQLKYFQDNFAPEIVKESLNKIFLSVVENLKKEENKKSNDDKKDDKKEENNDKKNENKKQEEDSKKQGDKKENKSGFKKELELNDNLKITPIEEKKIGLDENNLIDKKRKRDDEVKKEDKIVLKNENKNTTKIVSGESIKKMFNKKSYMSNSNLITKGIKKKKKNLDSNENQGGGEFKPPRPFKK